MCSIQLNYLFKCTLHSTHFIFMNGLLRAVTGPVDKSGTGILRAGTWQIKKTRAGGQAGFHNFQDLTPLLPRL